MQSSVTDALLTDIAAHRPDHVAVTGDLVNLALPAEFPSAARWLPRLGEPRDVSVVPGNHDAYVPGALAMAEAAWLPYMAGDTAADGCPYVRVRGRVALIGLSTAVPTGPFLATGSVGPKQRAWLDRTLPDLAAAGLCRVVMLHHPPQTGATNWHKRLTDAAALRDLLARHGAELVLHGHTHRASRATLTGPAGPIPVIGVPSAARSPTAAKRGAGWNLIEIDGTPGAWRIQLTERGFAAGGTGITDIARHQLGASGAP